MQQLTNTWEETVGLLTGCTITSGQVNTDDAQLILTLRNPEGKEFVVEVVGQAQVVRSGKNLQLRDSLHIAAYDPRGEFFDSPRDQE